MGRERTSSFFKGSGRGVLSHKKSVYLVLGENYLLLFLERVVIKLPQLASGESDLSVHVFRVA